MPAPSLLIVAGRSHPEHIPNLMDHPVPLAPDDEIIRPLQKRLEVAESKLSKLRVTFDEEAEPLRAEVKRLQKAMAVLSGNSQGLKDSQTLAFVEKALRAKSPCARSELKELVAKEALALGLSTTGSHLSVARVLKDKRFLESPNGVAFAGSDPQQVEASRAGKALSS